jgi:ribosomal protein S18 acetylase RimI-like enzyme
MMLRSGGGWAHRCCDGVVALQAYRGYATIRTAMATSLSQRVELRAAVSEDIDDIARIINYPPEPPLAKLLGSRRASRIGELLVKSGAYPSLSHTTVAVVDGAVAGVLECGSDSSISPSAGEFLPLLPRMLIILGPVTPRGVYGFWLRGRLQFETLGDDFPISELYVDEALRNRGIGGRLLEHADELAHRSGSARMSLETGITNPARRLYERHGFRVISERVSVAYDRVTGSPGRILMTKDI